MFLLNFITETLTHTVFIVGIIGVICGFILSFIPFIGAYKLPIQIISVLILALGVYLEGQLSSKKEYIAKIKELEVKLAQAEAAATVKNVEIQEKIVEKTKIVKTRGEKQIEFIKTIERGDPIVIEKDLSEAERNKLLLQIDELKKFNQTCIIPSLIIEEHNKATLPIILDKK